jgi:hypothetical protein
MLVCSTSNMISALTCHTSFTYAQTPPNVWQLCRAPVCPRLLLPVLRDLDYKTPPVARRNAVACLDLCASAEGCTS